VDIDEATGDEPKPPNLKECYRPVRNMQNGKGQAQLLLSYDNGLITLAVFDDATAQYRKCFTM